MLTFGDRTGAGSLRAGVAACTLAQTQRATRAPRRPPYHLLALTTTGTGTVEVDFTARACRPGTVLWVRPGQALRFGEQPGLDAALVAFEPGVLAPGDLPGVSVDDPFGPEHWQLTGDDEAGFGRDVTQLAADLQRRHADPAAAALLRHRIAVLLLRVLVQGPARAAGDGTEARTFARFRRVLEQEHPHSRRVEDYAERLGCSVRTLTRACLAVTGRSAKQVVDDRVALEARRLLACTDDSVADIGRRLGFGEPTNFGRFFHREAGLSPGAFRAAVRAAVPHPRQAADGRRGAGPGVPARGRA